jgi:hypothetical protein
MMWKQVPIAGFANKYEVSDEGGVKNSITLHILRPMKTGAKRKSASRYKVRLSTNPRVDIEVGALVLTAFVRPRSEREHVMHLDDNPSNNALRNLRWGTATENAQDCAKKKRGGRQILGPSEVAEIRRLRGEGSTGRALAKRYGVSEQRICDVYKGRTCLL